MTRSEAYEPALDINLSSLEAPSPLADPVPPFPRLGGLGESEDTRVRRGIFLEFPFYRTYRELEAFLNHNPLHETISAGKGGKEVQAPALPDPLPTERVAI